MLKRTDLLCKSKVFLHVFVDFYIIKLVLKPQRVVVIGGVVKFLLYRRKVPIWGCCSHVVVEPLDRLVIWYWDIL
jgi:hypothetical protein